MNVRDRPSSSPLKSHPWLVRCGLLLVALQLNISLFAVPALHSKVWLKVDSMMVAHYGLAALASLWLVVAYRRALIPFSLRHPVLLVMLAWVGMQCVAAIFMQPFWRGWYGVAGTGEGPGWWLAWAVNALMVATLWRDRRNQKILVATMLLALALLAIPHAMFYDSLRGPDVPAHPYEPNIWPDYLAFVFGYTWLVWMMTLPRQRRTHLAMAAIGAVTLYVSHNTAGIMLLSPALLFSLCYGASPWLRSVFRPTPRWRMLLCVCCVLPLGIYGYSAAYEYHERSLSPGEVPSHMHGDGGVGSRILLNKVGIDTIRHDPSRLLLGTGMGRFPDDLMANAVVAGVRVFEEDGTRRPNWFLIDGNSYHSHSQPLEALLAYGVLGLVLFLALPIVILRQMRTPLLWRLGPMLVAMTALSYIWFLIPHALGFHALAWGALLHSCSRRPPRAAGIPAWHRTLQTALLIGVAGILFWSAVMQYQAIQYGYRLASIRETGSCATLSPEWGAEDIHRRGGDRFAHVVAQFLIADALRAKRQTRLLSNPICDDFLLATVLQAEPVEHYTGRLLFTRMLVQLNMYGRTQLTPMDDTERAATLETQFNAITQTIYAATRLFPRREDKISLFLSNLGQMTNGDVRKQFEILATILEINPNHRSAQWLMGSILMQLPETRADGVAMKRRAAQAHVEFIYPVSPREREALAQEP